MIICGKNYFNYGNLFLNDPFGFKIYSKSFKSILICLICKDLKGSRHRRLKRVIR